MSSLPLVSVVIPTYNYGVFLHEAIGSVLNQTYTNIEIIIVDDGSTDNTSSIIRPFTVFPKIEYFYQKHSGVAIAMNTGFKLSKGEFIMTLGADDILAPTYIEKCLKYFNDKKVGFVWTGTKYFGRKEVSEINLPLFKELNIFNVFINPGGQLGAMLIRRNTFEDVGGFDPSLQAYEDWDLVIRMVLKGWKGVSIPEPIHFYRQHSPTQRNVESPKTKQAYKQLISKYPLMFPINLVWKTFKFLGISSALIKCLNF